MTKILLAVLWDVAVDSDDDDEIYCWIQPMMIVMMQLEDAVVITDFLSAADAELQLLIVVPVVVAAGHD